jgi:hypothetical protein
MVVVPLSKPVNESQAAPRPCGSKNMDWVTLAAAGTLAASGVLLVSGKRRAGLVTAAAGTALTMLDQQEAVSKWWNALPEYLAEAQNMLNRVQTALDDISAQRERLHQLLDRSR